MSTHNIPLPILIPINLNYPKYAAMGFFEGTPERARNSHGKRAISVRATEGLLYLRADVSDDGSKPEIFSRIEQATTALKN